jgi:MFS family permease
MSMVRGKAGAITFGLVGYLFLVELVSGILQGFYVPLIPDLVEHLGIRDADFNWFEASQLLLSALVVPILAKLGDMYGHKRILLISTVLTAGASWWLVFADSFWVFLVAWALQGFYVVWLPLEVALIFDRGRRTGSAASQTRRARLKSRTRQQVSIPCKTTTSARTNRSQVTALHSHHHHPNKSFSLRGWTQSTGR